jgi:hypothetical protein
MKKITLLKLRAAVRFLYYWRFISQFERDSFLMRIDKSYNHYNTKTK